jgi:methylenetetrahydrofolate/methylenetetrahydromethanopterin dehydrogenase (NADP+)
MKNILIQLDTDKYASAFDCIVAYDSGVDVVQSYSGIWPADVRNLILGSFFTRGIPDLKSLAIWIGGSDAEMGEQVLEEVRRAFFGPFRISLMLDSNGCNTTASTAIAKLARQTELSGKKALIVGPGPVGLRAAILLAGEGCQVILSAIPPQLFTNQFSSELAQRTIQSGMRAANAFTEKDATKSCGSLKAVNVGTVEELQSFITQTEIMVAAGPAGLQLISRDAWSTAPALKWILDFNLTEPLGVAGIKPGDDFVDYEGKKVMGALAIGNQKMKVHKACIAELFKSNDRILDARGVYQISKELI